MTALVRAHGLGLGSAPQAPRVEREARRQLADGLAHAPPDLLGLGVVQDGRDQARDLPHLLSPIPRVVSAGVPRRTPEATKGLLVSKGMVFLLAVMPAASSAFSATFPVTPFPPMKTSTRTRWLSVPPETRRKPCSCNSSASAFAFARMRRWYPR